MREEWIDQYRNERGSAYVLALFSLASLTILGLSLGAVTQTELILGANERTAQGVFYAADSGIAIASARTLVSNDQRETTVVFPRPTSIATAPALEDAVEISHFYPILTAACNLCEVNNQGGYHHNAMQKVNHAVTVRATRRGQEGEEVLAQKMLSAMIEIQPWKTHVDALRPIHDDPSSLSRIRF